MSLQPQHFDKDHLKERFNARYIPSTQPSSVVMPDGGWGAFERLDALESHVGGIYKKLEALERAIQLINEEIADLTAERRNGALEQRVAALEQDLNDALGQDAFTQADDEVEYWMRRTAQAEEYARQLETRCKWLERDGKCP